MSQEQLNETAVDGKTEHTDDPQRSLAEWTTLAISVAVLLGILGLISWLQFTGNDQPPVVTVEPRLDQLRKEESGYYLPVIVRNEGGATIEDVQIQAELDSGSANPEASEFTITFLVGGEEVNGTFIFQNDPTRGDLTTAAGSYKLP